MPGLSQAQIERCVKDVVARTPVVDMHTHLYPAAFGNLLLWGIDDLLTYHYLVAEVFRQERMTYDAFWAMSKTAQADLIWRKLFLEHSPISEACRGPLTCLRMLGLDVKSRDLRKVRRFFAERTAAQYIDTVFEKGNVKRVVMTNDPFDEAERAIWLEKGNADKRFAAVLRIDTILNTWPTAAKTLRGWGYAVKSKPDAATVKAVCKFLREWVERIDPVYMAVSLPPDFAYPARDVRSRLIAECVLPVAREAQIPFAMMIGVRKLANPGLRAAGDSVGPGDGGAVEALCRDFPDNRFLVTMLARENQHQLCVSARKFANLMPFGCWWFLNNPSLVEETTRMRTELLGLSFVPQHSDARVLDQLLYKWEHSRAVIAKVLTDKYRDLAATGWQVRSEEIERDVADYLGGNFLRFVGRPS